MHLQNGIVFAEWYLQNGMQNGICRMVFMVFAEIYGICRMVCRMVFAEWYLHLQNGICRMVFSICRMVFAEWYLQNGICRMVFAEWYLQNGICICRIFAEWYLQNGMQNGICRMVFAEWYFISCRVLRFIYNFIICGKLLVLVLHFRVLMAAVGRHILLTG